MKATKTSLTIFMILFSCLFSFAQNNSKGFKMEGDDLLTIDINQTFTSNKELSPFEKSVPATFGMAINAEVTLNSEESLVRVILYDKTGKEYLVFESYQLISPQKTVTANSLCEETCILAGVKPETLVIEVQDAKFTLNQIVLSKKNQLTSDVERIKKEKKQLRNAEKISQINKNLKTQGKNWVAGPTSVSELSYTDKKLLYGQGTFPPGFEYYAGGVITAGTSLKSAAASSMVENWDWRDRHGQNWITSIKNQGSCGSCWAFAATGATEALTNLYFNNSALDLNLAEQDVLSCSGAGDCGGGYPSIALTYINNTGVVDEGAFPYAATQLPCENKGTNPAERIKIGGKIDIGTSLFPRTDDGLKKALIDYGPISGGLYDWSHAMALVGYHTVEVGDNLYYRYPDTSRGWITVEEGSNLTGKTVWIFKNSWGSSFGDNGYVYVETDISNMGWTHALKTPVSSEVVSRNVVCTDADGDGYFWWGLGDKPANCPECSDEPDGNDADATLGPLDEYGRCIALVPVVPVADFLASDTDINPGETVTFSDESTGNPTTWSWAFEGGTPATSTAQNPQVTYNSAGTFNVTLTVSNAQGSDTKSVTDYITATVYVPQYCDTYGDATAEWINSITLGGETITTSTSPGSTGYTHITTPEINLDVNQSYDITLQPGFNPRAKFEYWSVWIDFNADKDFDDAGEQVFISSKNRSVVYGSISIPDMGSSVDTRMRVAMSRSSVASPCALIDLGDVKDYDIHIQANTPLPPVADFVASRTTISQGENIQFTDLSTNSPTAWSWVFGDGQTSSEQNPALIFNSAGTFDVTLSANNAEGSNTLTKTAYITVLAPQPPVADFTFSPADPMVGQAVIFSDQSTNNPTSWIWSFNPSTAEFVNGTSSVSQNPEIQFNEATSYSVTLTASNAEGASDPVTKSVNVTEYNINYCDSYSQSNNLEWISGVTIASFSKTSGASGYSDFTAEVISLSPGSTNSITLTPTFSGKDQREFWSVWIDFNNDGDFEDGDETVFTANNKKSAVSGTLSIPSYATGETRMRVCMKNGSSPSPCEIFAGGEVEDYTVNFGSSNKSGNIEMDKLTPQAESSISIFPNPANEKVFVHLNGWDGTVTLKLMDISGRTVYQTTSNNPVNEINVSSYPKGIYLLDTSNGALRNIKKIIIY